MSPVDALGWQGALFGMTAMIIFLSSFMARAREAERVMNWIAGTSAFISFGSFLAALWIGVQW